MANTAKPLYFDTPEKLERNNSESTKPNKGEIQVIYGPMFSGKTTELLRRIRRYRIRNDSCIIIKTGEPRYEEGDDKVVTHDQYNFLDAVACQELLTVQETACNYDVIGIDEGQFFPDTISFAEEMAARGKVVIIACLDGDYRRQPFGEICSLVCKAERVTKLSSVCSYCKGDAYFTVRTTQETEVKVIGGSEKYKPVCRGCYGLVSKSA